MEYFEKSALGPLFPIPTPWWKRYMDGVIHIVKKDQVDILFNDSKPSGCPHQVYTWSLQIVKEASLFWIPSAPLNLIKIHTAGYTKPTHIDIYLDWN